MAPAASMAGASKAGAAAAGRIFRSIPCPARELRSLTAELGVGVQVAPLASGIVFDIAVPSGAVSPRCLGCGAPIPWEKLAHVLGLDSHWRGEAFTRAAMPVTAKTRQSSQRSGGAEGVTGRLAANALHR
jgi:hypothetical protein